MSNNTEDKNWEADENGTNVSFVLENVRFAFTKNGKSFFEPEEFKKNSKFKGDFIIDSEDESQSTMVEEILQFLIDKNFKGKEPKHLFLRNGDDNKSSKTDEVYDGFEGNLFVRANRNEDMGAPEVFNANGDQVDSYPDAGVYKDGCYGNVMLRAYASKEWDTIGCTIEAVLYTDEGESFSVETKVSKDPTAKAKLFGGFKAKEKKSEKVFGRRKAE
jgi:hypothetical protein